MARRQFLFSAGVRAELEAALDCAPNSKQLVGQLEMLVRDHVSPEAKARRDAWFNRVLDPADGELQQLLDALTVLTDCIDALPPDLKRRLNSRTVGDILAPGKAWPGLTQLRELAAASRARVASHLRPARSAHRPLDYEAQVLANDLAQVFVLSGVRVVASRESVFATVLWILLGEIRGRRSPDTENVFPLVRYGAKAVRGMGDADIRQLASNTLPYRSNHRFWSQFLEE
jgi:hypothetical protein